MHPKRVGDRKTLDRFLFEARTTARFNHPHIVQIFHVGEHNGVPYVALEYLEGQSLRLRLSQGPLGPAEAARTALAIAEALAVAHGAGVLHRDLKPDNVFLPKDGRLRVLDFGLAKAVDAAAPDLPDDGPAPSEREFATEAGALVGTPAYMAPEQLRGEGVGPAADIWALGVLLHELLAGARPWPARGIAALRRAVLNSEPPTLDSAPEALRALVALCLDREPSRRPAAAAIARELQAFLHPGRARRSEESPFRGLRAFDERHAELFFGRDAELGALLETLRERTVVPLVGPSGAGKSSLVFGGLVARLREVEPWTVVSVRPGAHPFDALESRLATTEDTVSISAASTESSEGELWEAPRRLALRLLALAEEVGTRVLLVVDQLEEVFTLVDDPEVHRRFMLAICTAADEASEPVRVVFTLRDDFLGRVAIAPEVRAVLGQLVLVRAPDADALAATLTEPVRLRGYAFEPGVVEAMVAEVEGMPASLPLLQFAGTLLWERRDPESKQLTQAASRAIGGVAGALSHHADAVLDQLPPEQLALARLVLLRLVTAENTRRVVPRSSLIDALPDAGPVLDRLVDSRLLTRRRGEREALLELAHESLVFGWTRLARWLHESRDEVRFLAELEQATALWEQRGRRLEEAWSGDALDEAARAVRRLEAPPPSVLEFLDAGAARRDRSAKRRRRLLTAVIVGLSALVAASLWTALEFRDREQQALRLQDEQSVALLLAAAREAERTDRRSDAVALLRSSVALEDELGVGGEGTEALSQLRRLSHVGFARRTIPGDVAVLDAALRPDPPTLSIGDDAGRLRWLDPDTGGVQLDVAACRGRRYASQFLADGRLVRGCHDGLIEVRAPDGSLQSELRCGDGHVQSVTEREGLIAVTSTGRICTFDPPRALELGHGVDLVSWSAEGRWLAAAAYPWEEPMTGLSLIDLPSLEVAWRHEPDGGIVRGLQALGRRVLVRMQMREGAHSRLQQWDEGGLTWTREQSVWAGDVALSPDGSRIALATDQALLLDADGDVQAAQERRPRPTDTSFSADGSLVAFGDWDGDLRVLDAGGGVQLHVERAHRRRAFRPLWWGARLVTWSLSGEVSIWDSARQLQRVELSGAVPSTGPVAFEGGFVVGTAAGGLRVDGELAGPETGSPATSVAAGEGATLGDGGGVALGHDNGVVSFWSRDGLRWSRPTGGGRIRTVGVWQGGVVAGGSDGRVFLFDREGSLRRTVPLGSSPVTDLSVAVDGEAVAASCGSEGRLVLLRGDGVIGPLELGAQSFAPRFSPDGSQLAMGYQATRLGLFDARTGQLLWASEGGHTERIQALAWSPGGRIATGSMGRELRVWDPRERRELRLIEPGRGQIVNLSFVDESHLLVGTRDDSLELWNVDAPAVVQDLGEFDSWMSSWARVGSELAYTARERGLVRARLAPAEDRRGTLERTGAASNLRVCRGSERSVAVVPFPPPSTVWAPAESCGPWQDARHD